MPFLHVITYHYVRDLGRTAFPELKALLTDDFRQQVRRLKDTFEMATLESALDFLNGEYHPARDLCLLSFDDGLKDHYSEVMPILMDWGLTGLFFIITGCLEERRVAPVHKSHFLMASLGFVPYREAFLEQLAEEEVSLPCADSARAQQAYPLDSQEIATFKHVLNFVLPEETRNRVLGKLFARYLGEEGDFATGLYMNWAEAREIQTAGGCIGGHSHTHTALASLTPDGQRDDLASCSELLRKRLLSQPRWPFCFPYGSPSSFNSMTISLLRELNFTCSFTTEHGMNALGDDLFRIRRIDTVNFQAALL